MTYLENEKGFLIEKDGVTFAFCGEKKPGEGLRMNVAGAVPTPELADGDRILVPVGEGVALTVGEERPVMNASGDFCSKQGTMCLVILEREGKFLMISLDHGIHSSYSTKPDESGRYQLSITCRKECGVTYGVYDSLAEACHSYRASRGHVTTLAEKLRKTPEARKLLEGGMFWIWNDHYDEVMYAETDTDIDPQVGEDMMRVAEELYGEGVDKAMIGIFFSGDSQFVEPLYQKYGYIATQYDNYNDVLNPELLSIVPNNRARNCDYTARRMKDYPAGVQITEKGELGTAWALKGFDGEMHRQNNLCPRVAAERMREEIPQILAKYPYFKGRFIDVYGCRLGTCYSDVHPVTAEECRDIKDGAFRSLEEDMRLIAGTENGFDGIMEHLFYTEGLHSPVIFQIPDSGRKHAHVFSEEQTAHIGANMMDPARRVPLWQLAYHDCLVTLPYWGDSTESCPQYTARRVLFACLFGCPPLYSFSMKDFEGLKPAILDSYRKITAINRKIGTLPMSGYRVLAPDFSVQETVFGEKYRVRVDFGENEVEFEEIC